MSAISFPTSYTKNLPTQVPEKAAQGFIATVAIQLLLGTASNAALVCGSLASMVTLVEAITRPIIRAIFPQEPLLASLFQVIVPRMLIYSTAIALAPWVLVSLTVPSVVLPILAWIYLNEENFYERNIAMVEVL